MRANRANSGLNYSSGHISISRGKANLFSIPIYNAIPFLFLWFSRSLVYLSDIFPENGQKLFAITSLFASLLFMIAYWYWYWYSYSNGIALIVT
jgi:hypothetical protein